MHEDRAIAPHQPTIPNGNTHMHSARKQEIHKTQLLYGQRGTDAPSTQNGSKLYSLLSPRVIDRPPHWFLLSVVGFSVSSLIIILLGIPLAVHANESSSNADPSSSVEATPVAPLPPPPPLPASEDRNSTFSEAVSTIDAATVTINDYVLGAGDRLQIEVFESPEYSGEFEVLADGTLRMPFVNAVQVRGRTIDQASRLLSQQYSAILRRPFVSIRVLETRPIMLAVTGEVNRPGSYSISPSDTDGLPTVTQAIQLAGGITQSANIRSIQVQRTLPSGQESPSVISVDLWKLLQEADLRQDIALQDGDRLIVPEALILDLDEATEIASATFSPESVTVNVVGEVGSPGAVQVPPNTPLNQAILAAGGFTSRSRRGRVDLVRLNPNGTVTKREINVDLSENANDENNPLLRPNDTVIVTRSTFTRVTDTVTRALAPFTSVFSLLRIFGL